MSVLTHLERWKSTGAISGAQHDAIAALRRGDRYSVFLELNALLYLGVLALVGGVGWTINTYSARLGDVAILAALTAAFGWSLYYCFSRTLPYARTEVDTPGFAFDYVLYLGCLLLAVELAYVETRFHPFGADWDHTLLIAATVFFALAYRFDNRLVLSLALSSLGGWFGVRVSHLGGLFSESLRVNALAYGGLAAAGGATLRRAGIKPHFLETYLHVAANVLFLALLSGVNAWGDSPLYWIAVIGLSAAAILLALRFSRFAFLVYGVVYGYACVSGRLLRNLHSPNAGLAYFVISGTMVVLTLVMLARRFGRDA